MLFFHQSSRSIGNGPGTSSQYRRIPWEEQSRHWPNASFSLLWWMDTPTSQRTRYAFKMSFVLLLRSRHTRRTDGQRVRRREAKSQMDIFTLTGKMMRFVSAAPMVRNPLSRNAAMTSLDICSFIVVSYS